VRKTGHGSFIAVCGTWSFRDSETGVRQRIHADAGCCGLDYVK
jgi:hypothetical protein